MGNRLTAGDKVQVFIPKENREWGYNPCPDGTEVTFLRYSEIDYPRNRRYGKKPGIYENTSWAYVRDANGKEWSEYVSRFSPHQGFIEGQWLRELPETEFYEGDVVTDDGDIAQIEANYNSPVIIQQINYLRIGKKRYDGSPMPIYTIGPKDIGMTTTARDESKLVLVKRGNLWKYYHGEPLEFESLQEEASFFKSIGQAHEVKNPASGNYAWSLEEVLTAIQNGTVHSISVESGLFGSSPWTSAYLFDDAELGKRIAAETLNGFKDKLAEMAASS